MKGLCLSYPTLSQFSKYSTVPSICSIIHSIFSAEPILYCPSRNLFVLVVSNAHFVLSIFNPPSLPLLHPASQYSLCFSPFSLFETRRFSTPLKSKSFSILLLLSPIPFLFLPGLLLGLPSQPLLENFPRSQPRSKSRKFTRQIPC